MISLRQRIVWASLLGSAALASSGAFAQAPAAAPSAAAPTAAVAQADNAAAPFALSVAADSIPGGSRKFIDNVVLPAAIRLSQPVQCVAPGAQ